MFFFFITADCYCSLCFDGTNHNLELKVIGLLELTDKIICCLKLYIACELSVVVVDVYINFLLKC